MSGTGLTARRAAVGALAAGGLAACLVFLPPPGGGPETDEAEPPGGVVGNPAYFPPRATTLTPPHPPPPRTDRVVPEPPPISGDDGSAPPCGECLNRPGALDVAETFLYHMRREYIGVRAELYADIAARLEAAGLPPPHRTWLPKLPPGLVDAPADYSMSSRVLPEVERPGETWVVWVQEGWFTGETLESYISEDGPLPPAAASWPALKWETYLLVDARTGAVDSRVMWRWGTPRMEDMHAYGDRARREAAKRAEHWIAGSSGGFDE